MAPTLAPPRSRMALQIIAWLALAPALSGCIAAMELGRAETLGRGEWDLGAAVGISAYANQERIPDDGAMGGLFFYLPLPPVEAWGSYGLTSRLEANARVSLASAQLGLKAGLVREPRFALALAAAAAAEGYGRPDETAYRARLGLIAGYRITERLELDLAPQCSWPLDPVRAEPELYGATGSVHYSPHAGGRRRIGLALSWLHYVAPSRVPGHVAEADFIGAAVVFSARGASAPGNEKR